MGEEEEEAGLREHQRPAWPVARGLEQHQLEEAWCRQSGEQQMGVKEMMMRHVEETANGRLMVLQGLKLDLWRYPERLWPHGLHAVAAEAKIGRKVLLGLGSGMRQVGSKMSTKKSYIIRAAFGAYRAPCDRVSTQAGGARRQWRFRH